MNPIAIIDYRPEHQPWFEQLNRVWIEKYFSMEEPDIYTLTRPDEAILNPGGYILMALYNGEVAGTVALKKENDRRYEFTKMAVSEHFQRRGIAEALGQAALERARSLGAECVVLFTHSSLAPAIRLYEKMGFRHLPIGDNPYRRSDIRMEYRFNTTTPATGAGNL